MVRRIAAGSAGRHHDNQQASRGGCDPVGARFSGAAKEGVDRQGGRGDIAFAGRSRGADAEDEHGRRRHRQDQARAQAAVGPAQRHGEAQSLVFMTVITGIVAGVRALTAVLMLVAVALNFANIIGRYVFFAPIASAEEIMLFLLVGTVFLGNSVVAWEGRQIRMDVILQALPSAVRRWLELLADVTAIVVSVTLIWLGWPAIAMLVEFDQRSQAAEIPLAI